MRIFDKHDKELKECDHEKGHLVEEQRLVAHHKAVEAVEEKGHWETIAEYPNGGKDVDWIVDVPAVEAKDAWDEYEQIMRFVEFTAQEIATRTIAELKGKLQSTDYAILKIVEGAATMAEYAETIKQRAAWRKEINDLEKVAEEV